MKSLRSTLRVIKESVRDERGSASVELVVFAIPLFVPLILLASHLTVVSASKVEIAHLARTSLRAFATAENTTLGHARIREVLDLSTGSASTASHGSSTSSVMPDGAMSANTSDVDADRSGNRGQESEKYSYLIECKKVPCIQPLNRLKLTLRDRDVGTEIVVTTSTDAWVEAESGYRPQDRDLLLGYRDVAGIESDLSPILDAKELVNQIRDLLRGR